MNQTISQADDVRPGNLTIAVSRSIADATRRLTDDLQQPHKCQTQHAIPVEIRTCFTLYQLNRLPSVFQHMPKSDAIFILRHIAFRLPPEPDRGTADSRTAACLDQLFDR